MDLAASHDQHDDRRRRRRRRRRGGTGGGTVLCQYARRTRHAGRGRHRPVRAAGDHRSRSTSSCRIIASVTVSSSSSTGGSGGAGGGGGGGGSSSSRRDRQRPDLDQSALQRPGIRDPAPVRQRPASSRQGRPCDRGLVRLRHHPDLPERSGRLQELPPDRDRAQERLPQVPQGRDRADRGRRRIRRSAGRVSVQRRREGRGGSGTTGGTSLTGANNADNSAVGDSNGMSLPAVLDEVISVTGVYSFPYDQTPSSPPTDQRNGVLPNPLGPILLLGNSLTIGGTASSSTGGGNRRREAAATGRTTGFNANAAVAGRGRFRDLRQSDRGLHQPQRRDRLRGPGAQRPDLPAPDPRATTSSTTTTGTAARP